LVTVKNGMLLTGPWARRHLVVIATLISSKQKRIPRIPVRYKHITQT